jgi:hypothetical protein
LKGHVPIQRTQPSQDEKLVKIIFSCNYHEVARMLLMSIICLCLDPELNAKQLLSLEQKTVISRQRLVSAYKRALASMFG